MSDEDTSELAAALRDASEAELTEALSKAGPRVLLKVFEAISKVPISTETDE